MLMLPASLFFPVCAAGDQFQFKFIETFLLLFVSSMWMWFRIKRENERVSEKGEQVGVSWLKKVFIARSPSARITIPFGSTCSNSNLTQLSTNILRPLLTPRFVTAHTKKNPHRNILNKQIVHSAFPGLDNSEWKIDWTWIPQHTYGDCFRGWTRKKISADLHNNIPFSCFSSSSSSKKNPFLRVNKNAKGGK